MKYFKILIVAILGFISVVETNAQNQKLQIKNIVSATFYPRSIEKIDNRYFLTFDKAYFGTLKLVIKARQNDTIIIKLGEKATNDKKVDTKPPGTVRYFIDTLIIKKGEHSYMVDIPDFEPPAWAKNLNYYVPLPKEIGVNIMPFRYAEVIGYKGSLNSKNVQQLGYFYPFNDNSSVCKTSSEELNQIWELCKHSIKATSFASVYIDGDRERRPYEGDAYINQLSHYAVDTEYGLARKTIDHLVKYPTWPNEWSFHMHLILWEDYMYTGNTDYLKKYYSFLKDIVQNYPVNNNGLALNRDNNDIIDWPREERDGYKLGKVNNVPNAFYYNSLLIQSRIAGVLNFTEDSILFARKAATHKKEFNTAFWNETSGLYIDALDSIHTSIHANIFPVVFGLAEQDKIEKIWPFIEKKGMAVSVYGAQYLMEMLYMIHQPAYAYKLLTAQGERAWMNMIEQGATITWEAWSEKVKGNLDWNHAWGAAPGNIIARQIFGVRPLTPGFQTAIIEPQLDGLANGYLKHPTINGDIELSFEKKDNKNLQIKIRNEMPAEVVLPKHYTGLTIFLNSKIFNPKVFDNQQHISIECGQNTIEVKF